MECIYRRLQILQMRNSHKNVMQSSLKMRLLPNGFLQIVYGWFLPKTSCRRVSHFESFKLRPSACLMMVCLSSAFFRLHCLFSNMVTAAFCRSPPKTKTPCAAIKKLISECKTRHSNRIKTILSFGLQAFFRRKTVSLRYGRRVRP